MATATWSRVVGVYGGPVVADETANVGLDFAAAEAELDDAD